MRPPPPPRSARSPSPVSRGRISALALLCSFGIAHADPAPQGAPGIDPSIGKVEVKLDLPKDKPYVGEMIMLRMRSFIRAFIVLDEIRQPPLQDFDWQQLGRDKPIQAMVDGFNVAGVERDIAIFPTQAGRLIIDPFVRHVTIATDDNGRAVADFASKPVYVDVQTHTAIGPPDAWWLPAKSLSLTDAWSVPPDEIKPGTLSRRTVTVEAVGLPADRLPPPPKMMAPGTIVFKGPVKRETVVTEDGPVARATYQWDIRPVSTSPARMPAIHIPWFDTAERRMRDAAIPDVWVAYQGTLVHPSHEVPKTFAQTYLSGAPVLAGLAGFAWTAVLAGALFASQRRTSKPDRRRGRVLARLRRAARFRDEPAFRAALGDLAGTDAALWAKIKAAPSLAGRVAALDAARYGRRGGTPPALKPLADDLTRLALEHEAPSPATPDGLLDIDGRAAPAPRWAEDVRKLRRSKT